jgi:hypothetical protein
MKRILESMRSRRRTLGIALVCLVAAGFVLAAVVGGRSGTGSDGDTRADPQGTGASAAASETPTLSRYEKKHPRFDPNGSPLPGIEPAALAHGDWGVLPSTVQWPVTSNWTVASHRQVTQVFGGADARDQSTGTFVIMRWNHIHVTQKIDIVKVPGAGPVTITKAPEGRKVVVSAQKHGNFEFTSKSGITGMLHLKDDTVTLNH